MTASIVVLGLIVALAVKAPLWLGAAIVGFFAFFHGHAHGTQIAAPSVIPYAAGFALATAGLHTAGRRAWSTRRNGRYGKFAVRSSGRRHRVLGAAAMIGG